MPFLESLLTGAGSGLLTGALGMIGGSAADHRSYKYAKKLAAYQQSLNQDYATWSAKNLPLLNRQGMELAGFNPILAYSQGTGEQGHTSIPAFSSANRLENVAGSAIDAYSSAQAADLQAGRLALETASDASRNKFEAMKYELYSKEMELKLKLLEKDIEHYNDNHDRSRLGVEIRGLENAFQHVWNISNNVIDSAKSYYQDIKEKSSKSRRHQQILDYLDY